MSVVIQGDITKALQDRLDWIKSKCPEFPPFGRVADIVNQSPDGSSKAQRVLSFEFPGFGVLSPDAELTERFPHVTLANANAFVGRGDRPWSFYMEENGVPVAPPAPLFGVRSSDKDWQFGGKSTYEALAAAQALPFGTERQGPDGKTYVRMTYSFFAGAFPIWVAK